MTLFEVAATTSTHMIMMLIIAVDSKVPKTRTKDTILPTNNIVPAIVTTINTMHTVMATTRNVYTVMANSITETLNATPITGATLNLTTL